MANIATAVIAVATVVAAGFATYFAKRQVEINERMHQLSSYIAVAITAGYLDTGQVVITVQNAGRVNLYLHKWELGRLQTSFSRPWLMPVGSLPATQVTIVLSSQDFQSLLGQQHLIKLYLTDERDVKYITVGEFAGDVHGIAAGAMHQPIPLPTKVPQSPTEAADPAQPKVPQQPQPVVIQAAVTIQVRAWAYKTEKAEWSL